MGSKPRVTRLYVLNVATLEFSIYEKKHVTFAVVFERWRLQKWKLCCSSITRQMCGWVLQVSGSWVVKCSCEKLKETLPLKEKRHCSFFSHSHLSDKLLYAGDILSRVLWANSVPLKILLLCKFEIHTFFMTETDQHNETHSICWNEHSYLFFQLLSDSKFTMWQNVKEDKNSILVTVVASGSKLKMNN